MDIRDRVTRRAFMEDIGRGAVAAVLAGSALRATAGEEAARPPDLAVAHGVDPKVEPEAVVRKAVELLGGMKRFVTRGAVVVVKPNIGWDRLPRTAANTNPEVVATLVKMALEAGAKEVKVFDNPVNLATAQVAYERSGIAEAARQAGATVKIPDERFFKEIEFKGTTFLKRWPVYMEAIECDCLINVPIAKQHSTSRLTMALKGHMGIIGGERAAWHRSIDVALAEFATFVKPKLTVLDAYRILVRNGPQGGFAKDVEAPRKCIAGVDQAAVDAYGTTLFKRPDGSPMRPTDLGYLVKASELGVGEIDLDKLVIQEVKVT